MDLFTIAIIIAVIATVVGISTALWSLRATYDPAHEMLKGKYKTETDAVVSELAHGTRWERWAAEVPEWYNILDKLVDIVPDEAHPLAPTLYALTNVIKALEDECIPEGE